jgi:tryptophan synthase alpha chain
VIGSRIIQEIETAGKDGAVAAVQAFTSTIRTALDA